MEIYGLKVVEVGCVYCEVLVMTFPGFVLFQLVAQMSAFACSGDKWVIGKSRPLWPRANGLHLLIQY
jgi:hypothetical protein